MILLAGYCDWVFLEDLPRLIKWGVCVCVVSLAVGGWLTDAVLCKHILSWSLWPGGESRLFLVRGKLMTQWSICYRSVMPIIHYPHCAAAVGPGNIFLHWKLPIVCQVLWISSDFSGKSPTYSITHNQNMLLMHAPLLYIWQDGQWYSTLIFSLTHWRLERCLF